MTATSTAADILTPEARAFYCAVMDALTRARVPFLVGGAYALAHYAEVVRHTKDFDLFLTPEEFPAARAALEEEGHRTEVTFSHWLGKVLGPDAVVDLIFNSGNGACPVDGLWFTHAAPGEALGRRVLLCPAEEVVWQKCFIMERERYDGGDVAHLLRARGERLDWLRLLHRFGDHWRVLLSHLVLFGYVYPGERDKVPAEVLGELLGRLRDEGPPDAAAAGLCRGPLLSRGQYVVDVEAWGYRDPRVQPAGPLTEQQRAAWTDAGRVEPNASVPLTGVVGLAAG
jgi:hypothetical protein